MIVELREITKRYGSVLANDEASLRIEPGERVAIVGENGAGKSTLMKVLAGLVRPDAGEVRVNERPVWLRTPQDALRLGIGMVHQHFLLVPTLTVAENIVLGNEPGIGPVLQRGAIEDAVSRLAESVGLPVDPNRRVCDLGVAGRQRVEILKALYRGAQVLILDEPTAVLAPSEAEALQRQVMRLAHSGTSILWISHKLPEVLAFAERVVVMRHGRVVAQRRVEETSTTELSRLVMGEPANDDGAQIAEWGMEDTVSLTPQAALRAPQSPLLVLHEVWVRDAQGAERLKGVNLEVRAGEIVGIAGVDGNGQAELVDAILGAVPVWRGRVLWREKDVTRDGLAARRATGMAHVPEDRHRHGLVTEFTLAENLALGRHRRPPLAIGPSWAPRLQPAMMRRHTEPLLREFEVQPPDPVLMAGALSGGNQQKLMLARELGREDAALVIAEQPTRGLDIRATEFVANRLRAFRNHGGGVLLLSVDLDELFALADWIAVMFAGMIVALAPVSTTTREQVGEWMVGVEVAGPASRREPRPVGGDTPYGLGPP
jgi:simple sugar transport system ATP-binding protein